MSYYSSQQALQRFKQTREFSLEISGMFNEEEHQIQSMENASPLKWHLAHTTWFFEKLVLEAFCSSYQEFDPMMHVLYNSYYNSLGKLFPRAKRGMVTRPTLKEVTNYRKHVDEKIVSFLEKQKNLEEKIIDLIILGINHEQQHQELMLTDIKHALFDNPLFPAIQETSKKNYPIPVEEGWLSFAEGVYWVGADNNAGFFYDNEGPKHKVFLSSFKIATRLVTNREYLEFMKDGGYENPLLWLSEGWAYVNKTKRKHPFYWVEKEGEWWQYTLFGLEKINPDDCLSHINYYEASAFAQWQGSRLPTEAEWEVAGQKLLGEKSILGQIGNFAEEKQFQPFLQESPHHQFFGNAWEWTSSAYSPYPGFKAVSGAVGEYNGKFMCNQYVLKGGSCATPQNHIRNSYRNFFSTDSSWQFTSIRLCS